MKNLFVLAVALVAQSSFADSAPGTFLTFSRTSGFVPAQLRMNRLCEINRAQVRITLNSIAGTTVQVKPVTVDVKALAAAIDEAAKGKITTQPAPTDGPILTYKAFQKGDQKKSVVLEQKGSAIQHNDSLAAHGLVRLVNELCGE